MSNFCTLMKAVAAVRGIRKLVGTSKERKQELKKREHKIENKISNYILDNTSDFGLSEILNND